MRGGWGCVGEGWQTKNPSGMFQPWPNLNICSVMSRLKFYNFVAFVIVLVCVASKVYENVSTTDLNFLLFCKFQTFRETSTSTSAMYCIRFHTYFVLTVTWSVYPPALNDMTTSSVICHFMFILFIKAFGRQPKAYT